MGSLSTEKVIMGAGLLGLGVATGGFGLLGSGAAAAGTAGAAGGTAGAAGATGTLAGVAGGTAGAATTELGKVAVTELGKTAATEIGKTAVAEVGKTAAIELGKTATTELSKEVAAETAKKLFYSKLATGVAAAGTAAQVGSGYIAASEQNALLKNQEKIDEYNAQMEKAEKELDIAKKEREIQTNLAKTVSTQNNMFGAAGVDTAAGGNATNLMNNTIESAKKDSDYLKSVSAYNNKVYQNSAFNRTASYYAARKSNQRGAGANAFGSLLDFGTRQFDKWSK